MSDSKTGDLTSTESSSPLINLLLSPSLITEVRAKNSTFFNNFKQDSILTEICDWCFTSKFKSHPLYAEISKKAVSVLLSSPQSLIEFLITSKLFAKNLSNFLSSDDSKIPTLCSHFSEILISQLSVGTPFLFKNFPKVQKQLLNRIECLAIRYLILTLVSSKVDHINCEQMVNDLASLADDKSDENAIYLISMIYKTIKGDSKFQTLFNNSFVMDHLLNIAVKTKSAVIQCDLFNCLSDLNFNSDTIYDQQLKEKLTISESNINDLAISAIDVMKPPIESLISLFFSKNATMRFHQKILSKIDNCNLRELIEIANTPDFVVNIINAFGTEKWCPHCLQVICYLLNVENYCKPLKSKRWKTFIRDKYYKYIKIMNNEYGGHAPSPYFQDDTGDESLFDSDDSNNEDIKNMTFEEEEDFYDDDIFYHEEFGADVENIATSEGDDVEFEIDV